MSFVLHGRYCFVLHSRSPDAKVHKADPNTGLPTCGSKVGTDALEHIDDSPLAYGDLCKRCFKHSQRIALGDL